PPTTSPPPLHDALPISFRSNHSQDDEENNSDISSHDASGRILRDNVYGNMEDDAQRRDFTMNALYFDVSNEKIHDYSTGFADIRSEEHTSELQSRYDLV